MSQNLLSPQDQPDLHTLVQRGYQAQALDVSPQSSQHQAPNHKSGHLKEIAHNWLPTNSRALLFEIVAVAYLVVAVVHFIQTGDTSMFPMLLGYVAAYVGLTEIALLFPRRKKRKPGKKDRSQAPKVAKTSGES